MVEKGFIQPVKEPTTEKGTLIDHVYVKNFSIHMKIFIFNFVVKLVE